MTKKPDDKEKDSTSSLSIKSPERRKFLGKALGGAVVAAGVISESTLNPAEAFASTEDVRERAERGIRFRRRASRRDYVRRASQKDNNDDKNYNGLASFTKGLPHDNLGEVNQGQYKKYKKALKNRNFRQLDDLNTGIRPFVNPQSGVAHSLQGVDPTTVRMPPAPKFNSAELAGEMVELYWQALLRDINFTDYDSDSEVLTAAAELSSLSDFQGPGGAGFDTSNIFRGNTPGAQIGPYVSQFLLRPIPMGSLIIEQKGYPALPGIDHLTGYDDWLRVQNGNFQKINPVRDTTARYIRNGRDLAWYVWNDRLYQAYFHAAAMLIDTDLVNFTSLELRVDPGNPYRKLRATEGFATYGPKHILSLIPAVAFIAIKAVFFQKWFVHLRARPETIGGRIHNHMTSASAYPLHDEVLNSTAIQRTFSEYGTYLLPQVFIEGSPMHPSYGAAHAAVAGACVTVLKAFFDGGMKIESPVIPNADGTELIPYNGSDAELMTVESELDKLASNISIGRNFAGIHYRSDYWYALKLGELVAIRFLRRQIDVLRENNTYSLTKFNGKAITIR